MKNINFKKISAITENLYKYSQKEIKDILNEFGTSLDGITDEEAAERLEKYGENVITYEKDTPWFVYLAKSFVDPFILVLAIIAFVSFITDILFAKPGQKNWITLFIILTMIIISATLRFIQEYKSAIESDKLKQAVNTTTAIVRKDKGKRETYITEVVPGDIIHLAAGDMVPADMRIISCKDLFISQSALTGESEPVEKYVSPIKNINKGIADLDNICLMGTNVISGTAVAVVLSTGNDTYFGSMSKSLVGQRGKTSFERGVNSVSLLLIKFMLIMVPIVFLINGITKGDWLQAFLFSVSIAVGLTPEMLPTIVTTNLSKGAISLSKHKIIVKRLNSIQNFGAMDVLCTDKTGTLTLDKIVLEKHLDVSGNENDRVLRHAYLNSYYQTGLKNLMDLAVIEYGDKLGFNNLINKYKKNR
jgi:Mg2+-importing ATPase